MKWKRSACLVAVLLGLASSVRAQPLGNPQTVTVIDSGTACVTAPTACATFQVGTAGAVAVDVSGTWTGTLTFEGTANGDTWRSVMATNTASGAVGTTTTASGTFAVSNVGFIAVRVRATAAVTGTAFVTATRGYLVAKMLTPSVNALCVSATTQDSYLSEISANNVGFYSGATNCASGTLRFDYNGTRVNFAVPGYFPDGTASAPSFTFTSQSNTGIYKDSTSAIGVSSAGTEVQYWGAQFTQMPSGQLFGWTNGLANGTQDTVLSRTSAGIAKLAHGTATSTAEWQVSGGNGGFISTVKALTELTTIAAAATTSTAIQIPANAIVLGVSVRVVTIIPTAATFTVTSATPTKTWNTAAVAVAAGSTDPGTLGAPAFQTTASAIVITPNLTPGAATGQVRVTIFYYTITPPSS